MTVQITRIGTSRDQLGESPCWDADAQALNWIDALGGTLWRLHAGAERPERHELPAPVGSIAPSRGAAVVVALRNSFARYDFATRTLEPLAGIPVDHPKVRFNDGKCDPAGHFLAGTMHVDRQPGEAVIGGLYRLRTDRRVEQLADDIGFANGPCFSPDGRTLYLADSLERTIWAYDYDADGPLRNKRVFARTHEFDSGPDGATVDAQGFFWTVMTRAARLARYAPDGALERLIELPASYPTSICFGGPGLAHMYLTSISRSTRLQGDKAQDGGLFRIEGMPAPGRLPDRYGGC
ncbi:SMP-30/gluconolactonase/LRE family protein [Variovorax paradoxus]|uniref:SMP-30/gluconolactonase/LRE family protein n=1 Tax=Variovorax paradoxus TaxID=34073 RepID=UPI002788B359|nr:SMP-30/gluconolactonase/LRE family protein [Variovorax paradoxus]MDQ0586583.1 L-arabinonolactonase [Variovorax paradoxus]